MTHRTTKTILIATTSGAALLALAAGPSPGQAGLFDPENWTKEGLKAVFGKALQRRLSIDGDLDIDLGSTLRVVANDVAVENVDWASEPHMLTVDRLTIAIDLLELASGDIVIPEVRLQGPKVFVERNEAGEINWQTVLAGEVIEDPPAADLESEAEAAAEEAAGDEDAGGSGIPAIEDLLIEGAVISYVDRLQDLDVETRLERLAGTTGTGDDPANLTGNGQLAGLPLNFDLEAGSLGASEDGGPVPVDLTLRLAGSEVTLVGTAEDLVALTGLDLEASLESDDPDRLLRVLDRSHPDLPALALSGGISHTGDTWAVEGLDAQLGQSGLSGDVRLVTNPGEAVPRVEADLQAERLAYDDFRGLVELARAMSGEEQDPSAPADEPDDQAVAAAGGAAGLPRFDLVFQADEVVGPDLVLEGLRLEAHREQGAPSLDLQASGRYAGAPVTAEIRAGGDGASAAGPYPVSADVRYAHTTIALDGTVDEPLAFRGVDVRFDAASDRPLDILSAAGMEVPAMPATSFSGRLVQEQQVWRLTETELAVGESDMSGRAQLDLTGPEPAVDLDLASERLVYDDLQTLIAVAQALGGSAERDDDAAAGSDDGPQLIVFEGSNPKLDPAALPKLKAEVNLDVARFEAPDMTLRDMRLAADLDEGLPRIALKAEGEYRDEPLDALVALGVSEEPGARDGYPITVRLDGPANAVTVEGHLREPIALQGIEVAVEVRSTAPGVWLDLAGLDGYDFERVLGTAQLSQEDATWRLQDVYLEVGDSNLFGELLADLGGDVPRVEGELTSNRLIATNFIPAGEESDAPLEADDTPVVEGPGLEPQVLPDIDADLRLAIDYLEAEGLRLDNLVVDVGLRDRLPSVDLVADGKLQREPVRLTLSAGFGEGQSGTGAAYPVALELAGGSTKVVAEGTVAKPLVFDGLDIDVRLEGPTLDRLGEIAQLGLPPTPPYRFSSNLARDGRRWTLTGLDGRIGDSDLEGDVTIDLGAERPTLIAELRSRMLDFDDLGPLVGVAPEADEAASERQEQAAARQAADQWVLPDDPIDLSELRSMDARVTFTGEEVIAPNLPLQQVSLELRLEDGRMSIEPLELEMAEGEIVAEIDLDARDRPLDGRFDIMLKNLKLNQFLEQFEVEVADLEVEREGRGTLHGRVKLETTGNTIHEMAGSADGRLTVLMDGGRINALILEALGLDVGEIIALLVGGEPGPDMVPLDCFIGNFRIERGLMRPRPLVLKARADTVVGTGLVDLGNETLDMALEAEPLDTSVLSASTPIRIEGRWTDLSITPATDELVAKGLAAVGLGIVIPVVGAMIPFIEIGDEEGSGCAELLADAKKES